MLDSLRRITALGTALLLVVGLQATEPVPGPDNLGSQTDAEKVTGLIVQLGSSQFEEREAATRALHAWSPVALEPLRQACHNSDPEICRRARQLVQTIERQMEVSRILEPSCIRFVYQETPLSAARARGRTAVLQLAHPRLRARSLRYFWRRLGLFCRRNSAGERRKIAEREKQYEGGSDRTNAHRHLGTIPAAPRLGRRTQSGTSRGEI